MEMIGDVIEATLLFGMLAIVYCVLAIPGASIIEMFEGMSEAANERISCNKCSKGKIQLVMSISFLVAVIGMEIVKKTPFQNIINCLIPINAATETETISRTMGNTIVFSIIPVLIMLGFKLVLGIICALVGNLEKEPNWILEAFCDTCVFFAAEIISSNLGKYTSYRAFKLIIDAFDAEHITFDIFTGQFWKSALIILVMSILLSPLLYGMLDTLMTNGFVTAQMSLTFILYFKSNVDVAQMTKWFLLLGLVGEGVYKFFVWEDEGNPGTNVACMFILIIVNCILFGNLIR